jgi:hypothetical protein
MKSQKKKLERMSHSIESAESSLQLYKKFLDGMTGVTANKVDFIGIDKRKSIRASILQCMKKYYRVQNLSSLNDPFLALTKVEIQRLQDGKTKPENTPGFGSLDLFDNPKLKKPTKRITSVDVDKKLVEIDSKYKPKRQMAPVPKESMPNIPMRFTFIRKEDASETGSTL